MENGYASIDEIQNSPKAIGLLRYFYEELPEIYVIAAGSLLENLVDVKVSFPVGRVQYMALRPCSFREFLGAIGEEALLPVLERPEITIAFHDRLMMLFNLYTLIGGMPEAVQLYAERRDILALSDVYETLLQGYRDDVEKYARRGLLIEVIRFILKGGWGKAAQIVTLGGFASSNYNAREVGEAAQVQKEVFGTKDIMDAWRGMIAEHIVAQELLTLTDKVSQKRNFWVQNSKIYPIEVKAGHNAHLRSLHSFMNRSSQTVAVRVWSQPYSVDEVTTVEGKAFRLVNLPFYLVGGLGEVLKETNVSFDGNAHDSL